MIKEYSDHVCMCAVLCIQIIIEDIVHSALKTECQTNHTDTLTKRQRRGNHSTAKEPIKETKKWTRSNDTWMNCKCLSRSPESNWNIWCVRVILHTYPYRTHWLAASHVKAVYVCMSVCLSVCVYQTAAMQYSPSCAFVVVVQAAPYYFIFGAMSMLWVSMFTRTLLHFSMLWNDKRVARGWFYSGTSSKLSRRSILRWSSTIRNCLNR